MAATRAQRLFEIPAPVPVLVYELQQTVLRDLQQFPLKCAEELIVRGAELALATL